MFFHLISNLFIKSRKHRHNLTYQVGISNIQTGDIVVNVSDELPKLSNILTANIYRILLNHYSTYSTDMDADTHCVLHMPEILHSQNKKERDDRMIIINNNLFTSLLLYHSWHAFFSPTRF